MINKNIYVKAEKKIEALKRELIKDKENGLNCYYLISKIKGGIIEKISLDK